MNATRTSRKTKRHYRLLTRLSEEMRELAGRPDKLLTDRAPDVSGWCIAEQLEHTAESNLAIVEGMIGGLDAPPTRAGSRLKLVGHILLLTGFIPRGLGKAPERTRPRSGSVAEVRARVEEARDRVADLEPLLPQVEQADWRFDHPYFGGLTPRMWLRFMVIHTRHHLKIIRDIEYTLARPVVSGNSGRPADGEESVV